MDNDSKNPVASGSGLTGDQSILVPPSRTGDEVHNGLTDGKGQKLIKLADLDQDQLSRWMDVQSRLVPQAANTSAADLPHARWLGAVEVRGVAQEGQGMRCCDNLPDVNVALSYGLLVSGNGVTDPTFDVAIDFGQADDPTIMKDVTVGMTGFGFSFPPSWHGLSPFGLYVGHVRNAGGGRRHVDGIDRFKLHLFLTSYSDGIMIIPPDQV